MAQNDILIPTDIEPVDSRPGKSRAVAFVPITLALLGVAAILFGGVSARHADSAALQAIDPIETGSISK
jgi:acyl-coenzyme A thioesterase PaaI-like protein